MKSEKIFIGNLKKCTKHIMEMAFTCQEYIDGQVIGKSSVGKTITESELYQENIILLKLDKYSYVPLNDIKSSLHYLIILSDYKLNKHNSK